MIAALCFEQVPNAAELVLHSSLWIRSEYSWKGVPFTGAKRAVMLYPAFLQAAMFNGSHNWAEENEENAV